tara:strand:+ start:373 stop:927 length:555 start_codon:yes stop_codon:yes gene_type:complete
MNKYQEGKIYKIVCNITNETYYGSTIKTLEERLRLHKYDKHCMSREIINGGNYEIILIKNYPCKSQYELEEEEGKYIRDNECINKKIPHRTNKEYYEDNKNKINKQVKKWGENNKEKVNEYKKKYRENNKEKIKEWRDNNKEEINKKQKEKITCECGSIINRNHLARHKKTIKHIKLAECISID